MRFRTATFIRLGFFFFAAFLIINEGKTTEIQPVEPMFRSAELAFNTGSFAKAKTLVYSALRAHPDSYLKPEFLLLLSACYLKEGDHEQADILLRALVRMVPGYKEELVPRLLEASIRQSQGDLSGALRSLSPLKSDQALFHSGVLLEATNQSFAAVKKLLDAKDQFPNSPLRPQVDLALAAAYHSLKQFDAALPILTSVIPNDDNHLRHCLQFLKASTFFQSNQFEQALPILRALEKDNLRDEIRPYVYTLMGLTALKAGKTDLAKWAFEKNLKTKNAVCLKRSALELSGLFLQDGQSQKAIAVCNRVLRHVSAGVEKAPYILVRGLAYHQVGQVTLALKDFEAVATNPHCQWSSNAFFLWGKTLWIDHQYQPLEGPYFEALENFESKQASLDCPASLKGDDLLWARFFVGDAHFSLTHYPTSEAHFRKILDAAPNARLSAQAVSGLVAALVLQKKFAKAEKTLDELLVRFGEDRAVVRFCLLSQAHINWNQEKSKAAADHYEKYTTLFSGDEQVPLALYQWGRALEKIEKHSDALSTWARLRKKYPASPYAFKALVRSARLTQDIGDIEKSQMFYRQIAARDKEQGAELALMQMGVLAGGSNNLDDAIHTFDQFITRFPSSPHRSRVESRLQTLYQQVAQSDPKNLAVLVETYPDAVHSGEAWYHTGRLALEERNFAKALTALETVLTRYPRTLSAPMALFYKGKAEFLSGDFKKALASLGSFVDNFPAHEWAVLARYHRGLAMLKSDFPREAILVFEDLVERDPLSYFAAKALLKTAEAHNQLGNTAGQMKTYHTYLDQFSEENEANHVKILLATLKKRKGDYSGALTYYRRARPEKGVIENHDLDNIIQELEALSNGNGGE